MYYKLPIKERMDLMKSYKKANPDMSYRDMVNDYNTSYQKFGDGGKKEKTKEEVKPIYVTNPNDPNLQSYQDSLNYYNKTKNILNPSYYKNPNSPVFGSSFLDKSKSDVFDKKNNIQPRYKINSVEDFPGKIKPTDYKTYSEGLYYPIYKKPVQPYIYKEPEIVYQEPTKQTEPTKKEVIAKKVEPVKTDDGLTRSWNFSGPNPALHYYDKSGKIVKKEYYTNAGPNGKKIEPIRQ